MCMKYATFSALISITLLLGFLCGCSPQRAVPERDYTRALELVDHGIVLLRENKLDEARRSFELAGDLAPLAAAMDGLGCVELVSRNFAEAASLFEKAYEMDGSYDTAAVNQGLALELDGKIDEARGIYMKMLDKNPLLVEARNNLAALEYDRGAGTIEVLRELDKALILSNHEVIRDNVKSLKSR